MNDKEQFGAFLKAEKKRLRLNHSEFAVLIGHSRDTYISWYRGINGCEDAKKERILKILKKTIKWKGIKQKGLKPCPFCGGTDLRVWDNMVACMTHSCSGQIDWGHYIGNDKKSSEECQDAVVKAWNRRVTVSVD